MNVESRGFLIRAAETTISVCPRPAAGNTAIEPGCGRDPRLLRLILQFRGVRRANFSQAGGTVVPDHATEHHDDSEDEKDMNEPTHCVRSYKASDPQTEEENSD